MSDEATEIIVGDSAIESVTQPPRRRGRGRRRKSAEALTHCENCAAPLSGEYCAQCGQHAIDYRRSLFQVVVDAADSFLNWDTKFVTSLGVLITRPWRLTNDFNAGRRVRYIHPLRLYLLASIAFFLLAKLINLAPSNAGNLTIDLSTEDRAAIDASLDKLVAPDSPLRPEQRAKIETARARFLQPEGSVIPDERKKLDTLISRLPRLADKDELGRTDLEKLDRILAQIPDEAPAAAEGPSPANGLTLPASPSPTAAPIFQYDGAGNDGSPFGAWLEKRVKEKVGEDGTKVQLFLDTLRSNIPTMMLVCIPFFAFILKFLYLFRRRYYIEHLVYALHIHAFAYMATVAITLLGMGTLRVLPAAQPFLAVVLTLAAVVLVFLSVRRVYGQGWLLTSFKFFVGAILYLFVLALGVGATALVTLLLP